MVLHTVHRRPPPFSRTLIPRSLPLLVLTRGFFQRFTACLSLYRRAAASSGSPTLVTSCPPEIAGYAHPPPAASGRPNRAFRGSGLPPVPSGTSRRSERAAACHAPTGSTDPSLGGSAESGRVRLWSGVPRAESSPPTSVRLLSQVAEARRGVAGHRPCQGPQPCRLAGPERPHRVDPARPARCGLPAGGG
jgi:hypothetical protein